MYLWRENMIDSMIKILIGVALSFTILFSVAAYQDNTKYKPQHDMPVFAVFVEVVDPLSVNARCHEIIKDPKHDGDFLMGCASWIVESEKCHIVVPEPQVGKVIPRSMLEVWGHEIMHCVKGSYH